jgi:hypothetical protein
MVPETRWKPLMATPEGKSERPARPCAGGICFCCLAYYAHMHARATVASALVTSGPGPHAAYAAWVAASGGFLAHDLL